MMREPDGSGWGYYMGLDLRPLGGGYSVSPQLTPADMADLAAAGVTDVICNRPDGEVPPDLQEAALREAAEAAGMRFTYNPVVGMGLAPDAITVQRDAMGPEGTQVVAYCASGMRSALMWALARAGEEPTEDILAQVRQAGFQIDHLAGQIDGLAGR